MSPRSLHGLAGGQLFWDFDAIGCVAMGLAALFAAPALDSHGFERPVRIACLAHAAVTPLMGFVYFRPGFSERLLLGVPWAFTAPVFMLLMALLLRRRSPD